MSGDHRYVLVESLRRDEHSDLLRGHDERGRAVLVEVLTDEYPSPTQLARLRHEFAIESELALAGVAAPLSLEEQGHSLRVVWADPGGVPLRSLLAGGRVELDLALAIAADVARTLAAVHEQQVIHEGICPDSILVDVESGRTTLFGFGGAVRMTRETPPLRVQLDGSLAYLSPEQTGRMNRVVDRRSDGYSLGVVLYELLTGRLPFTTSDLMELLYCQLVRLPEPPHELDPTLPRVVSDLVMKLLAKDAEDRYQLLGTLADDLDACRARLDASGRIAVFELARGDRRRGGLDIPQRLYGRDAELRALLGAWQRVDAGAAELLLVRGYSGIGKSVLVHEIHKALTGARGYFVAGKYDQLGRALPHAGLARAFGELVDLLLTEPEAELERVRARLLAALGDNAAVLCSLVEGLERILGPLPAPPELGGAAARARFVRAVQHFVAACTSLGRPIVVFLDDLQWADLASLELLEAIFASAPAQLLVIGAYRSNEVGVDHPLTTSLREIEAAGATTTTIELGPLGRADAHRFIADALAMGMPEVAPLARLVYDKTEGNPFFLIQLLRALHADGLLRYDEHTRRHHWDEAGVRAIAAADNVVSFMSERMARLSPRACEALQLAACIGHRFDLRTLAILAQSTPQALAEDLWEALEEGILLPLDPSYRYLPAFARRRTKLQALAEHVHGETMPSQSKLEFRFLHDRVQQAAYALGQAEQRPALHLRIGRILRASWARSGIDETTRVFELVAHLNRARALLDDAPARLDLARLNLVAGHAARAATAYEAAATYYATGLSLLDASALAHDHAIAFPLYFGAAETSMIGGAHERAETCLEVLLDHEHEPRARAKVLGLRVVLRAAQGRPLDAVEAGIAGLRLLGIEVPEGDEARRAAFTRELTDVLERVTASTPATLAQAGGIVDASWAVALELARHTALSAFGSATSLGYWLTALAAKISLAHGISDQSAAAYALLGAVVASTTTRFAEAHQLVELALAIHERRGGDVHEACMLGFYYVTVSHYAVHWRALLPRLERARIAGAESGDLLFHSYICSHWSIARSILGDPLDEVRADVERMRALMTSHKLPAAHATQTVVAQTLACLEGRTTGASSLADAHFDEAAFVEQIEGARMSFASSWYRTSKGMLCYLADELEAARDQLERTTKMVPIAFTPEARFFLALTLLALASTRALDEADAAMLARARADLATWAAACPANYRHHHLLVEAEAARVAGQVEAAMAGYDDAIAAASEHDWPRDLALASELAAKFYLQRGRNRIARAYMTDASYGYNRWGALAQVRRLAERWPGLVPIEAQIPVQRARSDEARSDAIDMLAFARSLQTIAREVLVDNVVERMMQIVMQSAGAQRGVLILEREGALVVVARGSVDSARVALTAGTSLDDEGELPASVVRYATRRAESVVLDDAALDERFAGDPYIVRARPRSIACLVMTHQGRGKGVLYLENNSTRGAFTSRRVALLELLASQAVISLDNAQLFDALREREARWRALVGSAPDVILIVDREHRIEFANRGLPGLALDQTIGARVEQLMTPETRADVEAGLAQVFAHASAHSFESAIQAPGKLHHLITRLGPIMHEGAVDRVTLISSDVSEQRKLEEHLRQSQKMQAIGTLAGGIAHDFNNLLTVILGAAELCELDIGDNAAALESLAEITHAAERAAALTRQLLAFSRKQLLQPKPVDLDQLVATMTRLLTRLLGERVSLVLERATRPCPVYIDPGQLEQVVMNLAINARDAMPSGGTLTIGVALGERVELVVADTGSGMSDEVRARIFDPFFTTKDGKGTGLGLSTVLGIVEQSGGTITVESALGRGTCFRISLPLAETVMADATLVDEPEPARGSERIIVVEDEAAVQRVTARQLQLAGYDVRVAGDGQRAIALAGELDRVDLLVTDVVMPGMSGHEVAEQIAELHPHIKVLYTSGYTDDAIMRDGVLDGSKAFLHKPFTGEALTREVRSLLDR